MKHYIQNWDRDFERYDDGRNPKSHAQGTKSFSGNAYRVSEVSTNISASVTSVAPAEIPRGNSLWRRLSNPAIPMERNTETSGTKLFMTESPTRAGLSPQPSDTAPMQPSSTKVALHPGTTPPAEKTIAASQQYSKAAEHISEGYEEAGSSIISTEPALGRFVSAENTQPDGYMGDSDSSATLSSSWSTLSSSMTSIVSADVSIGTFPHMLCADSGLLSLSFAAILLGFSSYDAVNL
jgi:hypothetical protein